ncbi:response regulator [Leucothrix pacifica]|uniref:DNA-binding response regulator n=1 Tax=Leucothrix pacifica TaxID=1247513 RepID=A0A317C3X4_9GAMM|nr:response regulator transcription factor [Leucothrix pacifica]PWQ92073.1 DNA-binding response regulator [Leucothrix pacifica]
MSSSQPSNVPTAIIADDHQIVRQGLKVALESPGLVTPQGISVVAEAENGLEALAEVKIHQPDILLLDISMPLAGGAEVVNDIQRWSPDTRIVILTGIHAPGLIAQLLNTGIVGLFSKGSDLNELYQNLPLILNGGRYIASSFDEALQAQQNTPALTGREQQILNMIVAGKTNKEIAQQLVISPKTVDKHRTSLMDKLGVHSVAELLAYAFREGLIDPDHLL